MRVVVGVVVQTNFDVKISSVLMQIMCATTTMTVETTVMNLDVITAPHITIAVITTTALTLLWLATEGRIVPTQLVMKTDALVLHATAQMEYVSKHPVYATLPMNVGMEVMRLDVDRAMLPSSSARTGSVSTSPGCVTMWWTAVTTVMNLDVVLAPHLNLNVPCSLVTYASHRQQYAME